MRQNKPKCKTGWVTLSSRRHRRKEEHQISNANALGVDEEIKRALQSASCRPRFYGSSSGLSREGSRAPRVARPRSVFFGLAASAHMRVHKRRCDSGFPSRRRQPNWSVECWQSLNKNFLKHSHEHGGRRSIKLWLTWRLISNDGRIWGLC